jgi:hypothetical protein
MGKIGGGVIGPDDTMTTNQQDTKQTWWTLMIETEERKKKRDKKEESPSKKKEKAMGCPGDGCEGCSGCSKVKVCPKRRRISTSVPTSTCAFKQRCEEKCFKKLKFCSKRKIRVYYLEACLRPQNCRCVGTTVQCPFFVTPVFSTVPNSNLPSGYGTAKVVIEYNPNTKIGNIRWRIKYAKLYSFGNQIPARVVGIEIRGPSKRCNLPANIVLNPLAIFLLATAGMSADCHVTGGATIDRDTVQQFLHNEMYVVIRTQQFITLPNGELSGPILLKREERISVH